MSLGIELPRSNAVLNAPDVRRACAVMLPTVAFALLAWGALITPKIERMAEAVDHGIQKELDLQSAKIAHANTDMLKAATTFFR